MAQVSPQAAERNVTPSLLAWTHLLRAYATTTRLLSSQLQAEHGLTINDYEALYVLAQADGRRLKRVDLARTLLLTPSGVTRLLEGLERAGFVERVACSVDLRVSYAQLTHAGLEKLESASCSHVRSIRELFERHLSDQELDDLVDLLGQLPGVAHEGDACAP